MVLAPDYVIRPREAPAPEAGGRRSAIPGNGEEFSELLSKTRSTQAEQPGTGPQELALAPAAPPSLPLAAGLAKPAAFPEGGLLAVATAGETALPVPAADFTALRLPGIASGEVAADPKLEQSIQGNPSRIDPGSLKAALVAAAPEELPADLTPAVQSIPEPVDPKSLPAVARTLLDATDRIDPLAAAEVAAQAVAGGSKTDRSAAVSREVTPQIAAPALTDLENTKLADAGAVPGPDGSKLLVPPTPLAPPMDAGASAGLSASAEEIAGPAAASRAGTASRPEIDAHRSFERATHSEPATLATVPTASFGIAAAALDVQTASQPAAGAVPAVAASTPAITPRNIAKPDSGQGSDIPSSAPSLPTIDTFEFTDLPGTDERPPISEALGSSTQGAPALTAVASAPAAIQSSSLSVAVPAAMSPANAILVAAPADIASIVSNAADNGDADRIVIQLDPPELGRVSIDFKFDANGLQHVTVTGESPEAMRQLRLMHFELTQALERHGITSQNMSFQQQQQNAQQSPTPNPFARQGVLNEAGSATTLDPTMAHKTQTSPRMPPGGRLDMKL